ncbi:MAG: WG repeat-containing protein [Saprospirales bacterium]|nr:WG repeat-containing protein [Saprospirales bacterium]
MANQCNGVCRGRKNRLWGLYKLEGELVLPIRYEYVRAIHPDLLAARAPENDTLLHFFNGKGEVLFQTAGLKGEPGFNENTVEVIRPDMSRVFSTRKAGDPSRAASKTAGDRRENRRLRYDRQPG